MRPGKQAHSERRPKGPALYIRRQVEGGGWARLLPGDRWWQGWPRGYYWVLQVTPFSVKLVGGEFVPFQVPLKPGALPSVAPAGMVAL